MKKLILDIGPMEATITLLDDTMEHALCKTFYIYKGNHTPEEVINWVVEKAYQYDVNEIIVLSNGGTGLVAYQIIERRAASTMKVKRYLTRSF